MASSIFNMIPKRQPPVMNEFVKFMNENRGKDPNQMIMQLLQSGQITQDQLNAAQQKADEMKGMFAGAASMFGFGPK